MKILGLLSKILNPIKDIIDDVSTTDEERLELKNKLRVVELKAMQEELNFEKERMKAQAQIITAEAKGESWLQRNWRPIMMLVFMILIICDSFGLLHFRLRDEVWMVIKIGLGGYVIGRSAEKLGKPIVDSLKKKL